MGLFDGLFSDDPQKQALLMMGLGLLQGAPQGKKNFGADLAHGGLMGMQGYNQANILQTRKREEDQQREMRAMQMEQMKQQNERQQKIQGLAPQFFGPAGFQPQNDDEGNAMPPVPSRFDPHGYTQALAGIDPQAAISLQASLQKQGPKYHVVDGALVPEPSDPSQSARPVYQAPPKEEKIKAGSIREIKTGGQIHTYEYDGAKWNKIAAAPQFKPDGPEKPAPAPAGYRFTRDGNLEAIPGGPAENRGTPSEAELTAAGYGGRMMAAEQIVGKVGEAGQPTKGTTAMSMLPLSAEKQRFAERQWMSPEQQQYRQAQEDWVRAKLRKESGAVIADDEMKREIETYFPQLGDSPEVIKQKAQARQVAIRAMGAAAGKAKGQVSGVAGGWSIKAIP